jgi:hypothetical protein
MEKISDIVCCKMRRLLATGHRVGWLGYRLQYVGVCVCVFAWRAVYGERCIRCLCPSLAELVHDSHAVSDPKTKPWTWAWSSCPDGQLPMHVRINVPRGLLTVEDFFKRLHEDARVLSVGRMEEKQVGGHLSPYNLSVQLTNNTSLVAGVSQRGDNSQVQHSWFQFQAGCAKQWEKRRFAANLLDRGRGVGHWQQEQAALHMRFECDMEVLGSLAK